MRDALPAPGTVSGMQPDHEGDDDAQISFTAANAFGAGQLVTFANRFDTAQLAVGQQVEVLYDPANPSHAVVASGNTARRGPVMMKTALGLGIMFFVMGVVFALVMPPVLQNHSDMLQAGRDFVAAVRRGDKAAMRATAAPKAVLDDAYLSQVVRPSRGLEYGSSTSNFDDGCARALMRPGPRQLVMTFIKHDERWKVQSASEHHEECEDDIDSL
jgi:hypothetical protein